MDVSFFCCIFVPETIRDMKVEIIKNNSGTACGKQYMKFTDEEGNLLGCIQPTNLEFYALGGTTEFITYNYKTCKTKIFGTGWQAVQEIFSVTDTDETDYIFHDIWEQIKGEDFYKENWLRKL